MEPGFECKIGEAGKEDALFAFGVKKCVRENVLVTRGLPPLTDDGDPRVKIPAFSISEDEFLNLKLSFGIRLLMVDLSFGKLEVGDLFNLDIFGP